MPGEENLDMWIAEGEDDVQVVVERNGNKAEIGGSKSKSNSPKWQEEVGRNLMKGDNNNNKNDNYNNNDNNNDNYDNNSSSNNQNIGNIPLSDTQTVLQNARDFRVTFLGKPFEMVRVLLFSSHRFLLNHTFFLTNISIFLSSLSSYHSFPPWLPFLLLSFLAYLLTYLLFFIFLLPSLLP